jgi:hypothetical protein
MLKLRLNAAEVLILGILKDGPVPVNTLQTRLAKTYNWIFKCLAHLGELGFVQISRKGKAFATIPSTVLGNRLLTFLRESDFINPEKALEGLSLRIMPLLVPNGMTIKGIVRTSSLSERTVAKYLRAWKRWGLVTFERPVYRINSRHMALIGLIQGFSEHVNTSIANSVGMPYAMLWQGNGEFLISVDRPFRGPHFIKAADTALDEYGLDLVHRSEYYLFSPGNRKISRAEALVQALVIDRNEPRMARYFRRTVASNRRLRTKVLSEARRYGMEEKIKELIADEGA